VAVPLWQTSATSARHPSFRKTHWAGHRNIFFTNTASTNDEHLSQTLITEKHFLCEHNVYIDEAGNKARYSACHLCCHNHKPLRYEQIRGYQAHTHIHLVAQ